MDLKEMGLPVGSRIFSSPCHPDQLWGPPSLSNGYRGLYTPIQYALIKHGKEIRVRGVEYIF
jgi:hypothetical protein